MKSCDQCGACCKGHLIVEAYELDLLREPRLASADPRAADRPIEDVLRELQEDGRCLLIAALGPCKFLEDNRCAIYPTRPNVCVGLELGDEQCQHVRECEGLPPLEDGSSAAQVTA